MISLLARRGAVTVCILLSACAAGPMGRNGPPAVKTGYGDFLAARYAAVNNDPAAAAEFYIRALKAAPDNQVMAGQGFLASLLAGNPRAGALAAKLPDNALAIMLRGNEAALSGDFTQAGDIFASLPADDIGGLLRPLLLAWSQLGQGNVQAALNRLGPYFNNGPFGAVYVLNAALIADANGDKQDAAQLYQAVSQDQPNLRLAQILASWDTRQDDPAQAKAVLQALIAAHPDLTLALPALRHTLDKPVIATPTQGMAEAYLTLAGSLGPQQRLLRQAFLRLALQLRPDLSAARLLLARTQAQSDDPRISPEPAQIKEALATLAAVRPDDPYHVLAVLQEVDLLAQNNQPHQAVARLQPLLATWPDNTGLLADAGDVLRGSGDYAAALPYYTKAIAALGANPPDQAWSLFFDRGICLDQSGDWKAAEPDLQRALRMAPNQPYVLNYIGYSWALRDQNLSQAADMLKQAVALDPNDGAVIDSLGYVELKRGETDKALNLLTQAVHLSPDNAEVNSHLGDAFWKAGYKLQAVYQWRRALSLGPDPKLKAVLEAQLAQHAPAE